MSPRARIIVTIVGAGAVALLLWRQADYATVLFRNGQTFYAEISTSSPALPPATATTTAVRLPILVYHIVRPSYPSDDQAVRALAQTPEVFDAQMQYLATASYHVVPLSALENYFLKGVPLPAKPIIISFDDGWSNQFTYAFPILVKYHYPATFFVFTNPIGTRGFLTWDNLRAMRDAGMTIASHSLSHPFLTKISDPAALWNEISKSKKVLEEHLGITVNEFAYPFGRYTATTTALVKKAGYVSARGDFYTGEQFSNRLYMLSAMNAPTTTALFARKFPAE